MYLYKEIDEENIGVYELIPHEQEIKEFKRAELEAIPEAKRFMEHTTMRNKLYSENGILYVSPFNKFSSRQTIGIGYNDLFSYQPENERTREIRERFINNDYEGLEASKLYKLIGGTKEKNRLYLFVTEYYSTPYKKSELNNIMVLPRQLFIVRALETGRLDLIEGERLTEEIDLFDIKHVKDINIGSARELSKFGLLESSAYSKLYKEAEDLVYYSDQILKLKEKSPRK